MHEEYISDALKIIFYAKNIVTICLKYFRHFENHFLRENIYLQRVENIRDTSKIIYEAKNIFTTRRKCFKIVLFCV